MPVHRERIDELLRSDQPIKWLFAGDSITQGARHTFGHRDYVELFSERVRFELRRYRDSVINTAVSGWTLQKLLEDLPWSLSQHRPDVVSLNFGINDCYYLAAAGDQSVTVFHTQLVELLERVRSDCDPAIVIHVPNTILPAAGSRHRNMPPFIECLRKFARDADAVVVDHWQEWTDAGDVTHYWLSDSIHPNELGHRAMAHALFRALNMFDPKSHTCQLFVPR